jgi:hypothetical protein
MDRIARAMILRLENGVSRFQDQTIINGLSLQRG